MKNKQTKTINVVLNVDKNELFDEISEEMSIDEALTLILKSYKFVDSDLIVDQIMRILEDEDNYR